MSYIRNLQIYCSCEKNILFQQVCLNKSCRANFRAYCLKCDKKNEHFACQQNVKDEEGLIKFFEDVGKKMEIYIQNLQESLRKIVEGFNELTKSLRNKCQYNQQRLQELNVQNLKNILDEIFQFKDEFEKGLEEEMQNCSKNLLIKLNNRIEELKKKEMTNQERINDQERYQKEAKKRRSPMEILIEFLPDPTRFSIDPQITKIQNKFNIFSIELNQKAFENNITKIDEIQIPNDYSITLKDQWPCIRTVQPIVSNYLKDVYLMKRIDICYDDVYVLKIPVGGQGYMSINEAIKDCRSHLISKRFMEMFYQALHEKDRNVPRIQYSDLLILQENQERFWIAERFLNGEFIKFNNNYGYISENTEILNILAQVFTHYTWVYSKYTYMICNVQGVGYKFTDPSISTIRGNFDLMDTGEYGQNKFNQEFKGHKEKFEKFLKILAIYE